MSSEKSATIDPNPSHELVALGEQLSQFIDGFVPGIQRLCIKLREGDRSSLELLVPTANSLQEIGTFLETLSLASRSPENVFRTMHAEFVGYIGSINTGLEQADLELVADVLDYQVCSKLQELTELLGRRAES